MQNNQPSNFERISDTLNDGVIVVGPDGAITFINHSGLQMLGATPDSMLGRKFEEAVSLQVDGQTFSDNSPLDVVMRENQPFTTDRESNRQYSMARYDRSMMPVRMFILPNEPDGKPGATITFHDRTNDQKIERAKSEFVALVSHQLRTPVNVISWYVEKLLNVRRGSLNEQQQNYLNEIYKSNKRVISLIQAIVNVSRTDLSSLKLKHETVNLGNLVRKVIDDKKNDIELKQLHFSYDPPPQDIILHDSDQELCSVVIGSIIDNSIRYTFEGGMITVALNHVSAGSSLNAERNSVAPVDGIVVSIGDNGMGIPDEEKAKVFTKLFRGSNVQTVDVTGVGLGLYIANSFVSEMDGFIWFTSEVRNGTTFYIFLPVG